MQQDHDATANDEASDAAAGQNEAEMPFPEASFAMLITTLATQTTVALGQVGQEGEPEQHADLKMAKHLIDTLDVLEQKTKGNLSSEESALLTNYLYQLRMLFVAVQSQQGQSSEPPTPQGSIEMP